MTSLRHRTLWLVLGLLLLGTLIISLYNFHDSRHEIGEIYDGQLAQSARLLQGAIHAQPPDEQRQALYNAFNAALSQAGSHRIGHPYEGKMAFQVWDKEGHSLIRSSSAPAFERPVTTPGFSDQTIYEINWHGFLLPDDRHGVMIWVGEREDVRQDLVNRIVRHTLIPNLIGVVVLSVLIWLAIGWGLKPLQNMAQTIRKRHGGSLEPLQLTPLPRELEPMQAALNRLLSQIEQLLQRERRFIGDAAHEMHAFGDLAHPRPERPASEPGRAARQGPEPSGRRRRPPDPGSQPVADPGPRRAASRAPELTADRSGRHRAANPGGTYSLDARRGPRAGAGGKTGSLPD